MDQYEPTTYALNDLGPKGVPGGLVIVDDYRSHPEGAGRATDEYLQTVESPVFLHRIDGVGRMWINK